MTQTFLTRLQAQDPDSPAILAEGRAALTFGALVALAKETTQRLNALGIGRGDRVALVLPNGPEMAAAFLAVGAGATTCPLNPAYRTDEFAFYLEDLKAKALILPAASDSPARAVAERLDLAILEAAPVINAGAGRFAFALAKPAALTLRRGGAAEPDDQALILHTSGTTSRPKIVPLTHGNISASAGNIAKVLALGPQDRALNIMPLFHIHGLIGVTVSALFAGGSVFYTEGFNALKFMGQLEAAKPTWFSAVPTMHQAILARGARQPEAAKAAKLRFIRSSSASLPAQVMGEVEALFDCPVIESYGMTEAAHQMTSNRLPPGLRKAGSVGMAAGPQVALLTENGDISTAAELLGEVVICGPNVTLGYEANDKANAESFLQRGTERWFRTGDQGRFDAEGFLTITGRLKEIINRGGEKISPSEVDAVIMDHPAVAQVVTFAVPHDKLGEDVAAAVVLREGTSASEAELRDFLKGRLADFKVPRRVLILPDIPKGATGKLQRIGLAQKLGLG